MKKIFILGMVILLLCLTSCEAKKEEKTCEHVYQNEQVAPTCQEKGYMNHTCIFCGYTYQSDFVSTIHHSFSSWNESVEAACEAKGIRKRTCTYCGFEETADILPLGHDYELVEEQPASCEEEGYRLFQCKNNAEHTYKQKVEPLGHSLTEREVLISPTCEEVGVGRRSCQNCDYYMEEEILATGHHYEVSSEIKPSCLNAGKRVYVCTNDSSHHYEMEIPALGHEFGDSFPSKVPTCTEGGNYSHTCKRCSYTEVVAELIPTGHSFGYYTTIKAANCYASGIRERECEVCHYKETEIVPPTHQYSEEWTIDCEPTCLNEGEKSYHCIGCGVRKDITKIPATGHHFGEWEITTEATETTAGLQERKCTTCQYQDSKAIPKLPHVHTYNNINYNQTKHWMECQCGAKNTEEVHTFQDYHCKVCNIDLDTTNLIFSLNDDFLSYSVTGMRQTDKSDLIIPSEFNHLPVTSIGKSAFANKRFLTDVTIPNSITSIGFSAFQNCNKLSSLTIPFIGEKLNESDNNDFSYIFGALEGGHNSDYVPSSLKTVNVTGKKSIVSDAFWDCINIETITISDGVTNIGARAFKGCSNLISIEIPKSVTSIGDNAFYGCDMLTKVYYRGTIEDWCNIIFTINTEYTNPLSKAFSNPMSKALYFYIRNSSNEWEELRSIEIPDTITEIREYQFFGFDHITTIIVPNSVKSIGYSAFMNCNEITSITIPFTGASQEDLQHAYLGYIFGAVIKEYSSQFAPYSLKEVTITGESLARDAFYGLGQISHINITGSVVYIENFAFNGCARLESVTLPNSVLSFGDYLFKDCKRLKSITIPSGVTSIGFYAFEECYNLENVYYEGSIEDWCNISFKTNDANPMYYANHFFVRNEMNEWIEVTRIELPNTITEINNYQFYGFNNVTAITIPDSVTEIGHSAFSKCYSLTSVLVSDNVAYIDDSAFYNCINLVKVVIGKNVKIIGSAAFSACYKLVEVYNLSSLNITKERMDYGYAGYYAKVIHTSLEDQSNLIIKDDYLFIKDEEEKYYLVQYLGTNKNIVLPYDIEGNTYEINEYAFFRCSSLTSIEIPYSVTSIRTYAFGDCTSLTNVTIPNSVTNIGKSAFEGCSSLTSITIPSSLKNIGYYAFNFCSNLQNVYYEGTIEDWCKIKFTSESTNPMSSARHFYLRNEMNEWEELTSIEIPDTMKSIGDYQFYGFDCVTTIIVPERVSWIGNYSFASCMNLTSITIANNNATIVRSAFMGCNSLKYNEYDNGYYLGNEENPYIFLMKTKSVDITSCTINNNTISIEDYAFENCSGLTSITIPNSVTKIGQSAFKGCSSLTSVTIPSNVKHISSSAFSNCSNLSDITIEDGVQSIEENAFNNCVNLKTVTMGNSVLYIGGYAFYNCSSLSSITISSSVTYIGRFAFYNCSSLSNITIGNNVEEIGNSAFNNCINLKTVTIGSSVTSIGSSAFSNCSSLTSITIPSNVTTIGASAFSNCSNLSTINIEDGVKNIGDYAFAKCNLTSIVLPNSVASIGFGALDDGYEHKRIYFKGTSSEWYNIKGSMSKLAYTITVYFYSETQPTEIGDLYWHYVDGVVTQW